MLWFLQEPPQRAEQCTLRGWGAGSTQQGRCWATAGKEPGGRSLAAFLSRLSRSQRPPWPHWDILSDPTASCVFRASCASLLLPWDHTPQVSGVQSLASIPAFRSAREKEPASVAAMPQARSRQVLPSFRHISSSCPLCSRSSVWMKRLRPLPAMGEPGCELYNWPHLVTPPVGFIV